MVQLARVGGLGGIEEGLSVEGGYICVCMRGLRKLLQKGIVGFQ